MSLIVDGTNIEKVIVDGVEMQQVYADGTLVWQSRVLQSISVSQKNMYPEVGFDVIGVVQVTANYSDGTSEIVTSSASTSPLACSSGTQTYTVSYTENGVTRTASIQIYTGAWYALDSTERYWIPSDIESGQVGTMNAAFNASRSPVRGVRVASGSVDGINWETGNPVGAPETLGNVVLPISGKGMFSQCSMSAQYDQSTNTVSITATSYRILHWGTDMAEYIYTTSIQFYA